MHVNVQKSLMERFIFVWEPEREPKLREKKKRWMTQMIETDERGKRERKLDAGDWQETNKKSRSLYVTHQCSHLSIYNMVWVQDPSCQRVILGRLALQKTQAPELCQCAIFFSHHSYISHLTAEKMPEQSEEPYSVQTQYFAQVTSAGIQILKHLCFTELIQWFHSRRSKITATT